MNTFKDNVILIYLKQTTYNIPKKKTALYTLDKQLTIFQKKNQLIVNNRKIHKLNLRQITYF